MPKMKDNKKATKKIDAPFGLKADGTPRTRRARGTAPERHPIQHELNAKQAANLSRVEKALEKVKELEVEVQVQFHAFIESISPCLTFVHPETQEHLTIMNRAEEGEDTRYYMRPKPSGRKPSGKKKEKKVKAAKTPKIKAKGVAAKKVSTAAAAPAKPVKVKVKTKAVAKKAEPPAPSKKIVKVKEKIKAAKIENTASPPEKKVKTPRASETPGAKDSKKAAPPPAAKKVKIVKAAKKEGAIPPPPGAVAAPPAAELPKVSSGKRFPLLPHATARSEKVYAVADRWGKLVFKLLISYCNVEKMHYPSEIHPEGWCKVRDKTLSFDLCSACPFNEGVKPLWLDENPYSKARLTYVTKGGQDDDASVPDTE